MELVLTYSRVNHTDTREKKPTKKEYLLQAYGTRSLQLPVCKLDLQVCSSLGQFRPYYLISGDCV